MFTPAGGEHVTPNPHPRQRDVAAHTKIRRGRWHVEPRGDRFCVADDEGHHLRKPFFTEETAEIYADQQNARELAKANL